MQSDIKEPFRITIEHYDHKITFEYDHSDILFDDYMGALKLVTIAIFSEELWNEYFEEPTSK